MKTVVRGELLDKAKKLGTNLWPSELTDTKTLLELFLENGRGVLPKEKLASLLESTLPLRRLENEREPSKRDCKRRVASAAILCAIATWSFSNEDNHAAEIEAWTMYIAYILALAEKWKLPVKEYEDSFEIAMGLIYNSLANLCDEVRERDCLAEAPPLTAEYIYRVRMTWLLSLMGIYALWRRSEGLPKDEVDDFLAKFCIDKQNELDLWGEAAIPQFLAFMWYFRKIDASRNPDGFLGRLISLICELNRPEKMTSLASPYHGAGDVLAQIPGLGEEPLMDYCRGESYAIEGLVQLFVLRNWKRAMKSLWPHATRIARVSFEPGKLWDFYGWRNEKGTHKIVYPKHTQNWEELKALAFESDGASIPPTIKNHPILLLLFLCVYPHRMNAEILRWLDTEMEQIQVP